VDLRVEISGDIVDRQELLNGTRSVDLEGTSDDGSWRLSGSFSWNLGLLDFAGEGDVTLVDRDGDEIFGTLRNARVEESTLDTGGQRFDLEYEIDGGSGLFSAARGSARARGSLLDQRFQSDWRVDHRD
jgi:hypothetical protein